MLSKKKGKALEEEASKRKTWMKFWTGYVWQDGERDGAADGTADGTSLLLQHVRWKKRSIILAAVGREKGCDGPVGCLRDWFQAEGVFLCGRAGGGQAGKRLMERLGSFSPFQEPMIGLLMVEDDFWLIQGGEGAAYVFNRKFQRAHLRRLDKPWNGRTGRLMDDRADGRPGRQMDWRLDGRLDRQMDGSAYYPGRKGWRIVPGTAEKGVGILLGSSGFFQGLTEKELLQCLGVQDIVKESQIPGRLRELSQECLRRGGQGGGAVYVRTR